MDATWQILLIALVAIFLVLRLRSVLGRRTGNERPPTRDPFSPPAGDAGQPGWQQGRRNADAPASANGQNVDPAAPARSAEPAPALGGSMSVSSAASVGAAQIRQADPSFEAREFLGGAREAFEMIVGAFARGDSATLRTLLNEQLHASFDSAIQARKAARETQQTTIIGFESCELVDAQLKDGQAICTVRFVTEQLNVTRNADGAITDGNPNEVTKVTDIWTFQRDTGSNDPNWFLVATSGD